MSDVPRIRTDVARIEAKLDLLARAIGGDDLVLNWHALEREARRPSTFSVKRVNKARRNQAETE